MFSNNGMTLNQNTVIGEHRYMEMTVFVETHLWEGSFAHIGCHSERGNSLTVLHVGRMRGSAIEYRYYNPIPCLGMTTRYWMTQTRVRETALRLRVRIGNRRDQMCIDSEHRRMHLGFSFNDGDVFL
jgi:hypothetical protein